MGGTHVDHRQLHPARDRPDLAGSARRSLHRTGDPRAHIPEGVAPVTVEQDPRIIVRNNSRRALDADRAVGILGPCRLRRVDTVKFFESFDRVAVVIETEPLAVVIPGHRALTECRKCMVVCHMLLEILGLRLPAQRAGISLGDAVVAPRADLHDLSTATATHIIVAGGVRDIARISMAPGREAESMPERQVTARGEIVGKQRIQIVLLQVVEEILGAVRFFGSGAPDGHMGALVIGGRGDAEFTGELHRLAIGNDGGGDRVTPHP